MDNSSVDVSNWSSPEQQKYLQPYGITVMSRTANGIGLGAIILNVIFLHCICCIKDSGSIYNRFIQNLSVCDILGSITFIVTQNWPEGPFGYIEQNKHIQRIWVQGLPYVFRSIPWMLFTAYMLTLNCLSISQYLATCKPHVFMRLQTRGNIVGRVLGVVYPVSMLHIIVPLIVLAGLSTLPTQQAFRTLVKISRVEMTIWMLVYITSTCLSIALNTCIYCSLRHRQNSAAGSTQQQVKRQEVKRPEVTYVPASVQEVTTAEGDVMTQIPEEEERIVKRKQTTVAAAAAASARTEGANTAAKHAACVTMWCLCAASIAFRLPLPLIGMMLIAYIEHNFGVIASSWVLAVVLLLLYLVFLVDPVIYLVRMPEVRSILWKRMKNLYRRCCCRCPCIRNAQEDV